MTALYWSPMMASAVMVIPLSVSDAPIGRPILSMTSVWAAAPPNRGVKISAGLGRIPAALDPTTSTAAMAAIGKKTRETGELRSAVKSAVSGYLFKHTKRSPMVIPVVNRL